VAAIGIIWGIVSLTGFATLKNVSDDPDAQYLSKLEGITFRPVFIIGLHRSGTTLLHRLLAETGCFNYCSAYHVVNVERLLSDHFTGKAEAGKQALRDEFKRLGLTTRIIDETPAAPESPLEYGFALMRQTGGRPRITEGTLELFKQTARKLQVTGDPARPLLLKNPWDEIYFLDIKRWFPDAKFVFIHRHPAATLNSQMRAMRSLFEAKNEFAAMTTKMYRDMWARPLRRVVARRLGDSPFRIWEKLLAVQSVRMIKYYLAHFKELPAADCISLRYEDLCKEPDANMQRITDFLGIHPPPEITYREKIAQRESKLPPDIIGRFHSIRKKVAAYLVEQGYSDKV
jgi:hypothetical protein